MLKNKKHIKKDLKSFLDYTCDRINDQERNAFEKELQKDPFASEAMEGMSLIDPAGVSADMAELNLRLKKRLTIRKRVMIYRYAAAIAIFLIISASLLTVYYEELGLFPGPVAVTETPAKSESEAATPALEENVSPEPIISGPEAEAEQVKSLTTGSGAVRETRETEAAEESFEGVAEEEEENAPVVYGITADETLKKEIRLEETTRSGTVEDLAAPVVLKEMNSIQEQMPASETTGMGIITGVVLTSENNIPLPGTIISFKGTSVSTTTNMEGKFEIPDLDHNQNALVADFIGMKPQEVILADKKNIRIIMEPSTEAQDDVMIRGYGSSLGPVSNGPAKTSRPDETAGMSSYQPAAPADGYRRFRSYITENLNYPVNTELSRAVVVLSFVINPSGKPEQINVLMSPGALFSNEAIRLLLQGPHWTPAQKDGNYLEEETRIRVVFVKKG